MPSYVPGLSAPYVVRTSITAMIVERAAQGMDTDTRFACCRDAGRFHVRYTLRCVCAGRSVLVGLVLIYARYMQFMLSFSFSFSRSLSPLGGTGAECP